MFFFHHSFGNFKIPLIKGRGLSPDSGLSVFLLVAPMLSRSSLQLSIGHASLPWHFISDSLCSPLGSLSFWKSFSFNVSTCFYIFNVCAWCSECRDCAAVTTPMSFALRQHLVSLGSDLSDLCVLLHMDPVFLLFAHLVIWTKCQHYISPRW